MRSCDERGVPYNIMELLHVATTCKSALDEFKTTRAETGEMTYPLDDDACNQAIEELMSQVSWAYESQLHPYYHCANKLAREVMIDLLPDLAEDNPFRSLTEYIEMRFKSRSIIPTTTSLTDDPEDPLVHMIRQLVGQVLLISELNVGSGGCLFLTSEIALPWINVSGSQMDSLDTGDSVTLPLYDPFKFLESNSRFLVLREGDYTTESMVYMQDVRSPATGVFKDGTVGEKRLHETPDISWFAEKAIAKRQSRVTSLEVKTDIDRTQWGGESYLEKASILDQIKAYLIAHARKIKHDEREVMFEHVIRFMQSLGVNRSSTVWSLDHLEREEQISFQGYPILVVTGYKALSQNPMGTLVEEARARGRQGNGER